MWQDFYFVGAQEVVLSLAERQSGQLQSRALAAPNVGGSLWIVSPVFRGFLSDTETTVTQTAKVGELLRGKLHDSSCLFVTVAKKGRELKVSLPQLGI